MVIVMSIKFVLNLDAKLDISVRSVIIKYYVIAQLDGLASSMQIDFAM